MYNSYKELETLGLDFILELIRVVPGKTEEEIREFFKEKNIEVTDDCIKDLQRIFKVGYLDEN